MTYLLINILVLVFPLALSFHKGMQLHKKWWAILPAIFLTALIFIGWDVAFTKQGVWGFNPLHLIDVYLFGLPIEEMLFFVTVPYASVFIYEVFKSINKVFISEKNAGIITIALIVIILIIGLTNIEKLYTGITFTAAAGFLALAKYVFKFKNFGLFYFSYLIILIPFLFTNGILTGSFIEEEVVWYNAAHNLNIRIFTIPIEDSVYGLFLILMTIVLYESILRKKELK